MSRSLAPESAEARLLIAVARQERAAIPGVLDWPSFVQSAETEGILGLLVQSFDLDAVPSEVRRTVQMRSFLVESRSRLMQRELGRVLDAFDAAQIPILTFKGPVISQQLYGRAGARSFTDLDVIVARKDADRGEEVLRGVGYASEPALTRGQLRTHRRFNSETAFYNSQTGKVVDFHWSFTNVQFPSSLTFEDAWRRRAVVSIDGREVATLGPIDLVLTTVNHAAKHLWHHLEFLAQLHALASRPVDWKEVERLAFELRVARQLGLSFLIAERILGTSRPPLQASYALAQPDLAPNLRIVEANLFSGGTRRADAQGRDHIHLFDRRIDVVRSLAVSLLVPTWSDWRAASLPAPLYWFLRPGRLLWKAMFQPA